MFPALTALFGKSETAEKIVDGVSSGLDKMFFTDEEKSEASQKILDWKLKYASATTAQNMARRIIAIIVTGLWAFLILVGVGSWYFSKEFGQFVFTVLRQVVNEPFMIIIGFYFLAHAVRTFAKGK